MSAHFCLHAYEHRKILVCVCVSPQDSIYTELSSNIIPSYPLQASNFHVSFVNQIKNIFWIWLENLVH